MEGFSMKRSVALLCGIVILASAATALRLQSYVTTEENWLMLGRFCFLSEQGKFEYNLTYPKSYGVQSLLLYADDGWMYRQGCYERKSMLSYEMNQIIDLSTNNSNAGCSISWMNGQQYYHCYNSVNVRSMYTRLWYIALARCETSEGGYYGLRLNYTIHMMNGYSEESAYGCEEEMVSAGVSGRLDLSVTFVLVVSQLFLLLGHTFYR